MNQCGTFESNETGWTNVAVHVSVCIAHYRPPGGTDSHRLCWLLHLHLLPRHHTGHLCCLVVSILISSSFHRTVLMVHAAFLPLFSSVSTIRNQRYHIHANLSFAILVAEILLLISARFDPGTVGAVDTGRSGRCCCCCNVYWLMLSHQLPCKIMAILLHFFFLSAFSWMLVEGLHLYSMVVKVFGSEGSKHFYYYGIGWGESGWSQIILFVCLF